MIQPNTHRFSKLERVISGQPAAAMVAEEAGALDARRVLLVSNASLAREASLLDGIAAALGPRHVGSFTGCRAHVPYADVLACAEAVRAADADLLVAVGGGSVADAAKLTLLACWHGATTMEQMQRLRGLAIDPSRDPDMPAAMPGSKPLRMIAVPTTLSAAELNWGASATDMALRVKDVFGHALMVPRTVILDPAATLTVPDRLFLETGIKALDHAAERFCATQRSIFSDAVTAESLRLIAGALRRVRADGRDLAARHDAQTAMFLSATAAASGTGVGASHGIGHVLGAHGVPHGVTSCVLLPAVMRWNMPVNADRQRAMAALLGSPGADGGDSIASLVAELGLPGRLRDTDIVRADLPKIAEKSLQEGPVARNPRPIRSGADIEEILQLAW